MRLMLLLMLSVTKMQKRHRLRKRICLMTAVTSKTQSLALMAPAKRNKSAEARTM